MIVCAIILLNAVMHDMRAFASAPDVHDARVPHERTVMHNLHGARLLRATLFLRMRTITHAIYETLRPFSANMTLESTLTLRTPPRPYDF